MLKPPLPLTDEICARLASFEPVALEIKDDSAAHKGHAGNTGGGHFSIDVTSSQFCGKSQIIRHRLIYQAIADLMHGRIHALSIKAVATDQI